MSSYTCSHGNTGWPWRRGSDGLLPSSLNRDRQVDLTSPEPGEAGPSPWLWIVIQPLIDLEQTGSIVHSHHQKNESSRGRHLGSEQQLWPSAKTLEHELQRRWCHSQEHGGRKSRLVYGRKDCSSPTTSLHDNNYSCSFCFVHKSKRCQNK